MMIRLLSMKGLPSILRKSSYFKLYILAKLFECKSHLEAKLRIQSLTFGIPVACLTRNLQNEQFLFISSSLTLMTSVVHEVNVKS